MTNVMGCLFFPPFRRGREERKEGREGMEGRREGRREGGRKEGTEKKHRRSLNSGGLRKEALDISGFWKMREGGQGGRNLGSAEGRPKKTSMYPVCHCSRLLTRS